MPKELKPAGVLFLAALALCGCGTIRTQRSFEESPGKVLSTSIGGTVFRLNKTGDLPNVVGRRDIWGGKVNKGFAEVKLVGIEGSVLVLEITDVNKQSSETTMDRYKPFQNQNSVVNVDVNTTVTNGNGEQYKPQVIRFDTQKQKEIVIAGVRVSFLDVQPYTVTYRLEDVQAQ